MHAWWVRRERSQEVRLKVFEMLGAGGEDHEDVVRALQHRARGPRVDRDGRHPGRGAARRRQAHLAAQQGGG